MKKTLKTLAVCLVVMSLAACGSKAPAASVSESPSSASEETTLTETSSEVIVDSEASVSVSEEMKEEEPEETYSIKELFAEHGLKAGTCLTGSMVDNKRQSELILSQFSSVTMENAMKPESILSKKQSQENGELTVKFNDEMIKMLDFAKENGLAVRGHTIVWHSQTPDWIFYEDFDPSKELVGRDEMLSRMESMIKQIFTKLDEMGYIDLFYAYDIANECWMEDGTMRQSKWLKTIGEDYLWYAFNYANQYAPESIDLYYNDYNEQFKTTTLQKFVDTLVDENGNYLIDGLGFQAHLYTSDNLDGYFRTVDTLAAKGLKIELTELDVCLGAYQKMKPATDANLKLQGQFYYNLIKGLLERVDNGSLNMDALTIWGFADNLSWRKEYSPLIYDNLYNAKYAYYGVVQVEDKAGFNE